MTPMSQDGGRQYLPPRAVAMIESTVCAGLDAFGADPDSGDRAASRCRRASAGGNST